MGEDGAGAVQAAGFLGFFLAYLAILAAPGPNLFSVAGVSALHGRRGAVPMCAGIALGAGFLCAGLLAAASLGGAAVAKGDSLWRGTGTLVGAALLVWVAWSIARGALSGPAAAPVAAGRWRPGPGAGAFVAGFASASTNPVTAAFFLSQFLGALGGRGPALALVPPLVSAGAFCFFFGVSLALARSTVRAAVFARNGPIRLASALALVLMAGVFVGRWLGRALPGIVP